MNRSGFHAVLADEEYWRRQIKCQYACPVHTDTRLSAAHDLVLENKLSFRHFGLDPQAKAAPHWIPKAALALANSEGGCYAAVFALLAEQVQAARHDNEEEVQQ